MRPGVAGTECCRRGAPSSSTRLHCRRTGRTSQMTIDEQTPPVTIDPDKLMGFVFRAVDEVGATLNSALVVMGDRLGYYRALSEHGPLTATRLAEISSTGDKYAREWLNAQAAGGYVDYDPASG